MKQDTFKKLKENPAIVQLSATKTVRVLVNANSSQKAKLYQLIYFNDKLKVEEIKDEDILKSISGG